MWVRKSLPARHKAPFSPTITTTSPVTGLVIHVKYFGGTSFQQSHVCAHCIASVSFQLIFFCGVVPCQQGKIYAHSFVLEPAGVKWLVLPYLAMSGLVCLNMKRLGGMPLPWHAKLRCDTHPRHRRGISTVPLGTLGLHFIVLFSRQVFS